jgi:hypothetical protein
VTGSGAQGEQARGTAPPRRDAGATFVELLVSIVLLGTVVVGTLAALRGTVIASRIDRDHASGYAWLQAAADAVDAEPYVGCDTKTNQEIVDAYGAAAGATARPPAWDGTTGAGVEVVEVEYLARSTVPGGEEAWGTTCPDDPDSPLRLQLVTLRVTGPDAEFVEELQVIKRDD